MDGQVAGTGIGDGTGIGKARCRESVWHWRILYGETFVVLGWIYDFWFMYGEYACPSGFSLGTAPFVGIGRFTKSSNDCNIISAYDRRKARNV